MQGNQRQAVLVAYLAGIIDGEGCFRIGKAPKKYNPVYTAYIQVGMVDKCIPKLLLQTFGGNLREERVLEKRSIWRWTANSRKKVLEISKILEPYLIVKKQHVKLIIDFCENFKNYRVNQYNLHNSPLHSQELQRREDLYLKMKKLNAVGAAATTERREAERPSDSLNSQETERGKVKSFPAALRSVG